MSASHLNLGALGDLLTIWRLPFPVECTFTWLSPGGEADGGNLVRVRATDLGATLHQLHEPADLQLCGWVATVAVAHTDLQNSIWLQLHFPGLAQNVPCGQY